VCFLDSDDWWDDNKLEIVSKYTHEGFNFLYHPLKMINSDYNRINLNCRTINNQNPQVDLLINLNTIPTSSVCIKTDLLKNTSGFSLSKDIIGLEDYDFWIRLGGVGARFKLINTSLGYYFNGDEDNITYEDERQIARFEKLYLAYYSEPSLAFVKHKILAGFYFHQGRILQDGASKKSYRKYLFLAFLKGSIRVKLMALKRIIRF